MKTLNEVLEGLDRYTRVEMLRHFRPDCCIATTKTVIRVLDHFGYAAVPLECRINIYNRRMMMALRSGTVPRGQNGEMQKWCAKTGAWGIGLGYEPEPGEGYSAAKPWVGHLIVAMPERGMFIDASLDQASRPQKKICLPTTLIGKDVPEAFFSTTGFILPYENHDDGAMMFYQRIDAPGWKMSPDWLQAERTTPATQALIEKIEQGVIQ